MTLLVFRVQGLLWEQDKGSFDIENQSYKPNVPQVDVLQRKDWQNNEAFLQWKSCIQLLLKSQVVLLGKVSPKWTHWTILLQIQAIAFQVRTFANSSSCLLSIRSFGCKKHHFALVPPPAHDKQRKPLYVLVSWTELCFSFWYLFDTGEQWPSSELRDTINNLLQSHKFHPVVAHSHGF